MNKHFLHAYYLFSIYHDPEGIVRNREEHQKDKKKKKKPNIPIFTEPAYLYEGGQVLWREIEQGRTERQGVKI